MRQDERRGVVGLGRTTEMLGKQDWIEVLTEVPDETEMRGLRLNTHTGRPLGSDGFVSKLERFVERRLRPLPVGRPKSRKEKQVNVPSLPHLLHWGVRRGSLRA